MADEEHSTTRKKVVIVPEPYLVLFRTGTRSIRSGPETFFVPEPDHAKHFCQVFTYNIVLLHRFNRSSLFPLQPPFNATYC